MNNEHADIAVIGGDRRFYLIAEMLGKERKVITALQSADSLDFSEAAECGIIVLPLPAAKDGAHINADDVYLRDNGLDITQIPTLFELLMKLRPGQTVLGGMLPQWFCRRCGEHGIRVFDYFSDEKLEIMNIIPTVEGCIGILINELDKTIFGRSILITGYGKIGKVLSRYLSFMGAEVSVAARKRSDLAWIEVNGCTPVTYEKLAESIKSSDAVINTVPAAVIGHEELKSPGRCRLLVDIASRPGGIDKDAACEAEIKLIHALSLPGKTSPVSAAEYICEAISGILDSEEIGNE